MAIGQLRGVCRLRWETCRVVWWSRGQRLNGRATGYSTGAEAANHYEERGAARHAMYDCGSSIARPMVAAEVWRRSDFEIASYQSSFTRKRPKPDHG